MPDAIFDDPRLAPHYDLFNSDRSDLNAYVAMVAEFGALSVLDVGCGTGAFALMLAERGLEVVGVDPASASLDVARSKPGAGSVRFLDGDATTATVAGRPRDDDGQRGAGLPHRRGLDGDSGGRSRGPASGWTAGVRVARSRAQGVAGLGSRLVARKR